MGVFQNQGYLLGSPHNKACSTWVAILGSPYFGKLPYGAALGLPEPMRARARKESPSSLGYRLGSPALKGMAPPYPKTCLEIRT